MFVGNTVNLDIFAQFHFIEFAANSKMKILVTFYLSALASLVNLVRKKLFTGSIPERDEDKLYNTCTVYNPEGSLVAKFRKVRRILNSASTCSSKCMVNKNRWIICVHVSLIVVLLKITAFMLLD